MQWSGNEEEEQERDDYSILITAKPEKKDSKPEKKDSRFKIVRVQRYRSHVTQPVTYNILNLES